MRYSNNRYSTALSFVLTLCGIIGSLFALTACQGSDSFRPTPPSLSISQGKMYVQYASTSNNTGSSDSLVVFRADTGKFLWQASDVVDTPVADSTTVYTPTETSLIARDAESGKELWHISQPMIAAAVINGIVYACSAFNASSVEFAAFHANDGSQLWTLHLSGSCVRHIEVELGHIYVLTDESFAVLQADDGKLLWSSPARAFTRGNGIVYLSRWHKGGDGVVDALQTNDGKLLWTFHTPKPARVPDLASTILTSDGILCVNTVDTLYGLRARDGKQLWSLPGKSIGEFAQGVLTAKDILYIPSSDEGLIALQAQNGQAHWRFDPGGAILTADLDVKSAVIYATIDDPSGPWYLAAVRTDGSLLHTTRVQPAQAYQESAGVVYQLVAGGIVGNMNEKQHYTQIDLTATNGSNGNSLWSTHFQL